MGFNADVASFKVGGPDSLVMSVVSVDAWIVESPISLGIASASIGDGGLTNSFGGAVFSSTGGIEADGGVGESENGSFASQSIVVIS